MSDYTKDGYIVLRNVISQDAVQLIINEIQFVRNYYARMNNIQDSSGAVLIDGLVKEKCFSWYGSLATESVLQLIHPKMEEIVGKPLFPTYSFCRYYYNGSVLKPHVDRESCEYSATMCLIADKTPWEMFLEDYHGNTKSVVLNPGDMCVYHGNMKHWREKFTGEIQLQTFLHYVGQDGEFKDFKYDKRPDIGWINR